MKIVVLDGYTLNPGDLSWEALRSLGDVTVYDRTTEDQVVSRAYEADILLTNKTPVSSDTLSMLPNVKYFGVLATGYNIVDVQAAAARHIPVTNIPDYGTASVAQFVFALLLELCHHVQNHSDAVHKGEWSRCLDFCFTKSPQVELQDKTLGIIGFGRIGQQVARIGQAFGMNVVATSRGGHDMAPDVQRLDVDTLLTQSDVVSLHCPLTPETEKIMNAYTLKLMRPSAFLINTSRGGLIDSFSLADALNQNQIVGAAVDVLSVEPPTADNPLFSARNCLITPHIAWATKEARARLMEQAVANVEAFLNGEVKNVVNM